MQSQCTPFTTTPARIIGTFTERAFSGNHEPVAIAALDDGSIVVQVSPNGLFHIDAAGRINTLWEPRQNLFYPTISERPSAGQSTPSPTPSRPNYSVELLGAFDRTAVFQYASNWIYGVAEDGAVNFRFPLRDFAHTERPNFIGHDPDGRLWFRSWSSATQRDLIYEYSPQGGNVSALPSSIENAFQGPDGRIYARSGTDLLELRPTPDLRARYYSGPIVWSQDSTEGEQRAAVSRVGPDGSLWGSTITAIVHRHQDGQVSVITVSRAPSVITHPIGPLQFQIGPDGSAWLAGNGKLVRITRNDLVEVFLFHDAEHVEEQFSNDGTMWAIFAKNGQNVVIHFAPDA